MRLGPSTPGDYVRARVLVPLKPGCDTGDVVTFVLLLNWVGIYLYLVTANKILTNFKSNAQL